MVLLKLVPFATYFLDCLEKFASSMKSCYIQDCRLTIACISIKMLVYLFMENSAPVSKSMLRVNIIS